MADAISGYGNTPPSWQTDDKKKTDGSGKVIDAVYGDGKDKQVSVENFLELMVAQLKNQDFMNPVDDTAYVTQLAQFATMQQMQEMAYNSKSTFMMSLVGKDVTVAKLSVGGTVNKQQGTVEKVSFVGNDFRLVVKGKEYTLEQIMEINEPGASKPKHEADPSSLSVAAGAVNNDSAVVSWPVPTTDTAIADELRYTVYYSTEKEFDTVEDVKKGKIAGRMDSKKINELTIEKLDPATTYYVNVVVKDSSGMEAIYQKVEIITPD